MSYSACDFMDDVCAAAREQLGAVIPDDEQDNQDECANAVLDAISRAQKNQRALRDALGGLFEHCVMIHKHWGDGDNSKQAAAAITRARALVPDAGGST